MRGDEDRIMIRPSSRPEARRRFGFQTANELGAPVASSIPEQWPGREPASARKGLRWQCSRLAVRCVEGSFGRHALARGAIPPLKNLICSRKSGRTHLILCKQTVILDSLHHLFNALAHVGVAVQQLYL